MQKSIYRKARPTTSWPNPLSDRIIILGGLRRLLGIHAHYEDRGERIVVIIGQREDSNRFEASITEAGRLFHVKLQMVAQGVRGYGREKDLLRYVLPFMIAILPLRPLGESLGIAKVDPPQNRCFEKSGYFLG